MSSIEVKQLTEYCSFSATMLAARGIEITGPSVQPKKSLWFWSAFVANFFC